MTTTATSDMALHRLMHRTQLLLDPAAYLPTAEATHINGRTRHTLIRMAQEARLTARRTSAQSWVFSTTDLVRDRLSRHANDLTLFDALAHAHGHHVDEDTLTHSLTHHHGGERYTLARRDHAPPDWPSWAAWFRGHHTQAQALLAQEHPPHLVTESAPPPPEHTVVWVATRPLTAFGDYTLSRYTHLRAAGAHVGVLPARKVAFLETRAELPEMEILPEAIYLRRHTRVGSRNGATCITDPALVTATHTLMRWLHSQHTIGLDDLTRNHTCAEKEQRAAHTRPRGSTPSHSLRSDS